MDWYVQDPQTKYDIKVDLGKAAVHGISAAEVTRVEQTTIDTYIYRKNLRRVVYVTGDVSGQEESPVCVILKMGRAINRLRMPTGYSIKQYSSHLPDSTERYSMKWDGEWQVTYEVFRDLGLAFAAVLVLIYVLVVGRFKSFKTPWVIMAPIPLTLVGGRVGCTGLSIGRRLSNSSAT